MTAAVSGDGGPVDRYLDELFDLLAGTGAAGRRLLLEAEEHLTEATADGRARGLDPEAAEHAAVGRFGPAATVARRVPAGGTLRLSLPRLLTAVWVVTGVALTWYGLSGLLTRLLSRPWTELMIATDRFGAGPLCTERLTPEYPVDCPRMYQQGLNLLPRGGNDLPYLVVLGVGLGLLALVLVLRRTTVLGTPSWTPPRRGVGLTVAVPAGLIGVALVIEAVDGVAKDVQYYVPALFVAGLLAVVTGAVALRWALRAQPAGAAADATGPPAPHGTRA